MPSPAPESPPAAVPGRLCGSREKWLNSLATGVPTWGVLSDGVSDGVAVPKSILGRTSVETRPVEVTVVLRSRCSSRRAAAGFCGARKPRGVGSGTLPPRGGDRNEKLDSDGVCESGLGLVELDILRARESPLSLDPGTGLDSIPYCC